MDFLLYAASLDASVATRSKISFMLSVTDASCRDRMMLTVDERVQDGHGTVGDTSVGVDLLQDYSYCQLMIFNRSKRDPKCARSTVAVQCDADSQMR